MKLKHILILQNKIDLVKESQAKEQYEQILAFVQGERASEEPASIASLLDSLKINAVRVTSADSGLFSLTASCRHGCRRRSHHSHIGAA